MDRHVCMYTLKGLYKLLTCFSHTRCVFTGDLGIFTNGYGNQMEPRVYDSYYRLSEEGVQPVLANSPIRSNTYSQTHASETKEQAGPGDVPWRSGG